MYSIILKFAIPCFLAGVVLSACSSSYSQQEGGPTDDYDILQSGFVDPPDNAKVKVYWWWINGSADKIRIREELEAFREAGISAVDIFDIGTPGHSSRSEEHTSELQSRGHLVCRLLLEKKNMQQ